MRSSRTSSRIALITLLGGLIAATSVLATGCVGRTQGTIRLVAEVPPPAPRQVQVQERPGYVWIRGHWVRYDGGWVWQEGYWVRDRPGYVYVPGHWERRGARYVWIPPRWVDEETYHRERKARGEHERDPFPESIPEIDIRD